MWVSARAARGGTALQSLGGAAASAPGRGVVVSARATTWVAALHAHGVAPRSVQALSLLSEPAAGLDRALFLPGRDRERVAPRVDMSHLREEVGEVVDEPADVVG